MLLENLSQLKQFYKKLIDYYCRNSRDYSKFHVSLNILSLENHFKFFEAIKGHQSRCFLWTKWQDLYISIHWCPWLVSKQQHLFLFPFNLASPKFNVKIVFLYFLEEARKICYKTYNLPSYLCRDILILLCLLCFYCIILIELCSFLL